MLAQVWHNTTSVPEGQRPPSIRDSRVKLGVITSNMVQAHTGVHPMEQNPHVCWTWDVHWGFADTPAVLDKPNTRSGPQKG